MQTIHFLARHLPARLTCLLLIAAIAIPAFGQQEKSFTGLSIMCVSAHPDDEDGMALATCARLRHIKSYSVFFTRGEGGQNETGNALYDDLGLLRTAETIDAATILGSEAHFLGFQDFGFSKTARETFARWGGEDSVVSRLVFIIRALKPDVIITNHDTITLGPDRQHGNHQAAGIAVFRAFTAAADPHYHPEQFAVPGVAPWQVRKLFGREWKPNPAARTVFLDTMARLSDGTKVLDCMKRALACHKSQGFDKIVLRPLDYDWAVHRYVLIRDDGRGYRFDSTDFFSSISPVSRKVALLPPAAKTAPQALSLDVDPPVIGLTRTDAAPPQIAVQTSLTNRTRNALRVSLTARQGQEILLRKTISAVPGTITDSLHLTLKPSAHDPCTVTAIVLDGREDLPSTSKEIPLKLVRCEIPKGIELGFVATYDNTVGQTLDALNLPYTALDSTALASADLSRFTSILLDIRCFAFRHDAARYASRLLAYVHDGGNLLCFYNKPGDWRDTGFSPYRLTVTNERVTEEDAPVTILRPEHPFFNAPNRLTRSDWDGWIQERNIYLPSDDTARTSPRYERLLGMSDSGERQPPTSLLTAAYGDGTYTYTSLALYRQLRVLHEGAVKLFLNLIGQQRNTSRHHG